MEYTFVSIRGVIRPAFGASLRELQDEVRRRGKTQVPPEGLHLEVGVPGPPPLWKEFYGPNAGKIKHKGYLFNRRYQKVILGKTLGIIFRSHDLLSLALAEGELFEPKSYIALSSDMDVEIGTPFERGGGIDIYTEKKRVISGFPTGVFAKEGVGDETEYYFGEIVKGKPSLFRDNYSFKWKKLKIEFPDDTREIHNFFALPDGQILVNFFTSLSILHTNGEQEIFDIPKGVLLDASGAPRAPDIETVTSLGDFVIGGTESYSLMIWDLKSLEFIKTISLDPDSEQESGVVISMATRGTQLAVGEEDSLHVFDFSDFKRPEHMTITTSRIDEIAFLEDGRIVTRQWEKVKVYEIFEDSSRARGERSEAELVEMYSIPLSVTYEDILTGMAVLPHNIVEIATNKFLIAIDVDSQRTNSHQHDFRGVERMFPLKTPQRDIEEFNVQANRSLTSYGHSVFTAIPSAVADIVLKFITG